MEATTPEPVKIWGRGQLTIPKKIRRALHLDEHSVLSAFVVGSCLILTSKRLLRTSLAKEAERSLKKEGLSLNDLLKSLKDERKRYGQEKYGG